MNPEHMCIEEEPEPSPFHGQFGTDFFKSDSQYNNHFCSQCSNFNSEHCAMSSVYKDSQMKPFTEGVSN